MSPEHARVLIAEDDEKWRGWFTEAMVIADHQVVVAVDSIEGGVAAIPGAKELGVNVALVDGSLPYNRHDGTRLVEALHKEIPGIKVVDVSTFGTVKGADSQMVKLHFKSDNLGKLVTNL